MNTHPPEHGSRVWFFPDGDIPPAGETEPFGHESLVILNPNSRDAIIHITIYFEHRDPHVLSPLLLPAQRVKCYRVDQPMNDYRIPMGQYALKIESDTGVIAQMGRMDVRQPNLAYYTTMGFAS